MRHFALKCYYSFFPLLLIVLFCVCKQHHGNTNCMAGQTVKAVTRSGLKSDTANESGTLQTQLLRFPRVYGYYFVISGDFDGDGDKETLREHFYSPHEQTEISKWHDNTNDYDTLIDSIVKQNAISFAACDSSSIDTLHCAPEGMSFGLSYLKNEGDLNGDGADEVSYVVNFTDWSELNTWFIMTCKNGIWKKLYTFPIWEWQLPALPNREYVVRGSQNIPVQVRNNADSIDDSKSFKGLVKKISTGKIQVVFRNGNNEVDTMLVELK